MGIEHAQRPAAPDACAIRRATLADIDALVRIENASFPGNRLDRRRFRYLLTRAHGVILVAAGAKACPDGCLHGPAQVHASPSSDAANDGHRLRDLGGNADDAGSAGQTYAGSAAHELRGYVLVLFRENSPIARLYSIATAPGHLGRGVGSALVRAAERLARDHGYARQRLEIRADNAASLALFDRHDYRPFGRHPGYYHDGMDAVRLEKQLTV